MYGEAVSPASGNHGNSFHLQLPQNKLVIIFYGQKISNSKNYFKPVTSMHIFRLISALVQKLHEKYNFCLKV